LPPLAVSAPERKSAASAEEQTQQRIPLNPLLSAIQPSKTVEIFSLVKQMEAEGTKVTSLCVGEPDYDPPRAVLDAVVDAVLKDGQTRYTAVTGTLELRRAKIISSTIRMTGGMASRLQE